MDRHETYTELLRDHSALIWSMCRNTAHGDYERCRDLFQDVSLRLWQHYDELRSDAKPHERKAWVEWQVRHVLNHAGRRERPVPMSDLPEQPDIDALDKAEIRTLVNDLLTQLNPDERQMLQMRMDGYSAGEIAKEMGLSRDTVYQRMHRTLTKARRILLVLFLLFMASSITVAVVPSWRQKVFGGGNPSATDTTPSSTAIPSTPVPAPVADSTADSIPAHRAWVPTQPIQHLVAATDTSLPMPLPTFDEPCGCPQGYQRKTQADSLDTLDDPCEPIPDELPPATIRVVGNTIVVEDVMNELVDIYDTHGRLVATAHCDGRCAISFRIEQNYPRDRSTTTHVLWVHVGNRPRQRVIIEDQRNDSPRVYVR